MSFKSLMKSFKDAGKGLKVVFQKEQNFRIKLLMSLLVILFMFLFGVDRKEGIILILLIFSVLSLELLNTVIEEFVDLIKPRLHHKAKRVKDIMASVVLVASFGAMVVGLAVFYPYIIEWLFN